MRTLAQALHTQGLNRHSKIKLVNSFAGHGTGNGDDPTERTPGNREAQLLDRGYNSPWNHRTALAAV